MRKSNKILPRFQGGKDEYSDTIEFLKHHEGFNDVVYKDGNGIPTIGYGFTDPSLVKKGRISEKAAQARLRQEVITRDAFLKNLKNWDLLGDGAKTALRSYYYNYPAGFRDTTKFMKAWNAGDYAEAIRQVDAGMNDSRNPGLRKRRLAEQGLLNEDPYIQSIINQKPRYTTTVAEENAKMQFQPWSNYHGTDYPINNPAPASMSSWNSPQSPAYTPVEYSASQSYLRLPDIKDVIEQSIMTPKFKNGKLPGYRTGTIPYVSSDGTSYNINPNVVGSDQLNITTPEVVVTGKDRRPMYQRYDAENSTYNPNTIRNFTDWMPIVSDVGDSLDAYNAFKNKDYTTAATLTGLLFLPNLAENIGKYAYRGLRHIGIPQMFTKELLQNGEAAWKRFKNLDLFDRIRGIKYTDNVWHGSNTAFDINHARAYAPGGMDTGFHMGSSPTPAYSRANGLQGGVIYSGKLKMKEAPFELDDLNRWGWREIVAESDNNPAFKKYLEDKGIDIDRLVNTATDLEKEYDTLDAIGQQAYLKEHGGFESDKYMAKLFKDKNISLKYKNKFETFDGVPEYSYAIYNPNNVVWNKQFTFSKKQNDLQKLYDLGLAGKYDFNDPDKITVNLDNLYRVLKDFPKYRLPGHKDGKSPIHIKPANRGKFTALKKRTGHSASWFKKNGTPAQKKMAVFALNARKWSH